MKSSGKTDILATLREPEMKKYIDDALAAPPTHPETKNARNYVDPVTKEPILLTTDYDEGKIRVLTMNRPKSKNATNSRMFLAITDALDQAEHDERVLSVVITGTGDFFTAGADLKEKAEDSIPLLLGKGIVYGPTCVFFRTVIRFPKPLIAAVNGPGFGVGLTLIPHCDLVYASDSAYFVAPFARNGLAPEFCSTRTLPEIMGPAAASELLLFGKKLTSQRGYELGLINKILPSSADFLNQVLNEVRAGLTAPLMERSLPLFKGMMKQWNQEEMERLSLYEMAVIEQRQISGETAMAIRAFLESQAKAKQAKKAQKSTGSNAARL